MKRAHRDRALNRLFADLRSGDFDTREYAIFQLALMLRRANNRSAIPADELADEHLSSTLLRIHLSPADQARVTARLAEMLGRHADSRASAIWALGEVAADHGFPALIAAIRAHGEHFSHEAAYQACQALRHWLEAEAGDRPIDALLDDGAAMRWLRRWSRSDDPRLARNALAVVRKARESSN